MFIKEGPNTKCVYEQRNVIDHDNEKFRYFLKERDVERLKSFNCKSGDILITCAGTIGEQYILPSESPTGIFNQALMRVRLQTNVDRTIFSVCFDKMISYSKQKYSNGSAIKNIPPLKDLKNRVVYLPKLEEQEYIAKFIELLSKKINLLNLKISTLKKYKEGLVLKALKPTIENWKSDTVKGIRLSSFLVPYKKLGATKNYIHATLSREGISDKTERYNRDFLVKDENKKYRITDEGDLVYNPANLKFGVICINHYGICVVSPIYETFKVRNIDRDLLESIVTSKSFIRYALKFEEGTVYERRSVSVEDLLKIKVCLEDINQEKFVNILKTITDKLMLLSSMKEHCENLKQFLLRNMFI